MGKPDEFRYLIKKPAGSTKWVVVPQPSETGEKPGKGTKLFWEFEGHYAGLEAHLQFCDHIPGNEEICIVGNYDKFNHITADWTGSIPGSQGETFLTAELNQNVPPKKSFHYGLWIVDPRGVNDFAIGDNPPPKIETGG